VIAASVHGFPGATILIHGSEALSASCLQVNVSVLAVFTISTVVPKSESTDGSAVLHVGTTSDDHPTEPTPTTLHVRVVAALIVNPTKQ